MKLRRVSAIILSFIISTANLGNVFAYESAETEEIAVLENENVVSDSAVEAETETTEKTSESEETTETLLSTAGTWGDNGLWNLDNSGILTISGTGDMPDYSEGGAPWYDYCSDITEVIIEDGVTGIGYYAFCSCTALKTVAINSDITRIGFGAFRDCTALENISIPESVTVIEDMVFYNCSSLTNITISDYVTSIGDGAFYRTGLTEVIIGKNVTSIGESAFMKCYSLTDVSMPEGLLSIGDYTFYDCRALLNAEIPDSVEKIGKWAFGYCSSLTEIYIGKNTASIGLYAFLYCSSLNKLTVNSENTAYASEDDVLFNKSMTELIIYPTNKTDETYDIPDGVTVIDEYAFYDSGNLTSVTVPDSVTVIETYAFSISGIKNITIGIGVVEIEDSAFAYCSSLTDVYYKGTAEDWTKIQIGTDNKYLLNAVLYDLDGNVFEILNKVTISALKIVAGGIELTWNSVSDAEGYKIYRRTDSDDIELIASVENDVLSYIDTTVEDEVTYYYYVQAYSAASVGLYAEKYITYFASTVREADSLTPEETNNAGGQNYSVRASTVKSYLVDTDKGYMRVEYNGSNIAVEYYNSSFELTEKKYVTAELSLFGGFFAGEDSYYFVFGQKNADEDDSTEVIRVVRYSKNWERTGQASIYGGNTYIPFDAGSLRMTEADGKLYIHTCHEMYASIDGLNHQANMIIYVYENDMSCFCYSSISSYPNYVSHSFNQFVIVDDDGTNVTLDHGDAYPRAATLHNSHKRTNVFSFQGGTGVNATGASLGGFEYSDTSYLTAGNSVDQDDNWSSHTARNIFVTATSRSNFSEEGTALNWITDYDTDGTVSASTPQLVKIDGNKFLLMWTTDSAQLNYVFLDGDGNTISEIYTAQASLSDCKPIVSDNKVIWYCTNKSIPLFYTIDLESYETVTCSEDIDSFCLTYTIEDGAVKITGCKTAFLPNKLVIPSEIEGYPVTAIDRYVFYGCTGLKSVVIPDSVISIGTYAFNQCTDLKSVNIPNSLTNVSVSVFGSCPELKTAGPLGGDYNLQFSWTEVIPRNAFNGLSSLTELTLPDGITSIGSSAFSSCTALTEITIPASVTSINSSAFNGCSGLEYVYCYKGSAADESSLYPDEITLVYIGESTAESIEWNFDISTGTLTISGKGEMVDYGTLQDSGIICKTRPWEDYLTDIKSIVIEEGVEHIGSYAFGGCKNAASVTLPSSLISIGDAAFDSCSSLTSLYIQDGLVSIGKYAFYYCSSLSAVYIPPSVTEIEMKYSSLYDVYQTPFYGCSRLLSIICKNNSYALEFAQANGIAYKIINDIIYGDADGDGILTASDAAYILQYVLDNGFHADDEDWLEAIDVDNDDVITASDAAYVLQKVLDNDFDFPAAL